MVRSDALLFRCARQIASLRATVNCTYEHRAYYDQAGGLRSEPTIRGMRITVSHVLEMLAGGMTPEDILKDFPYLEKADIDAALEYAARHVAHREIPLSK
jgi:uncharacterized protein (DUF433 family)